MERHVVLFLKSSLAWLVTGVTLGVGMAVHAPLLAWRTAHIHALLLGFVTGMIFGVGYHVFPRFAGHSLRFPGLAMPHWWLANGGVAAMVGGFILRAQGVAWSPTLLGVGGSAAAMGAYLFAYNVWRTLDAVAPVSPPRRPEVRPCRWCADDAPAPSREPDGGQGKVSARDGVRRAGAHDSPGGRVPLPQVEEGLGSGWSSLSPKSGRQPEVISSEDALRGE